MVLRCVHGKGEVQKIKFPEEEALIADDLSLCFWLVFGHAVSLHFKKKLSTLKNIIARVTVIASCDKLGHVMSLQDLCLTITSQSLQVMKCKTLKFKLLTL